MNYSIVVERPVFELLGALSVIKIAEDGGVFFENAEHIGFSGVRLHGEYRCGAHLTVIASAGSVYGYLRVVEDEFTAVPIRVGHYGDAFALGVVSNVVDSAGGRVYYVAVPVCVFVCRLDGRKVIGLSVAPGIELLVGYYSYVRCVGKVVGKAYLLFRGVYDLLVEKGAYGIAELVGELAFDDHVSAIGYVEVEALGSSSVAAVLYGRAAKRVF